MTPKHVRAKFVRRRRGRVLGRIAAWGDSLRESFYFFPLVLSVLAAVLAFVVIEVDHGLPADWIDRHPALRAADADGTRALLSAIVGSMITVTGVVFSITIVALTLTSQQFGPRLLRNFVRDRGNQLFLGTYVATFLYSLIVLRAVRQDSVPHLASALAVVLAIVSGFVLIWFVHHTATSIQASSIIATVAREIDAQLEHFDEVKGDVHDDACVDDETRASWPPSCREVRATETGYVRLVAIEELVESAAKYDAVFELTCRPGDFVASGASIARLHTARPLADDVLPDEVLEAILIGDQRTALQDLRFLLGQLVEIAVRALSPGINDPATAIACIERLGASLARLAQRSFEDTTHEGPDGRLRVVAPCADFAEHTGLAFDSIRHYGAGDTRVVLALLHAFEVALTATEDVVRRAILVGHVEEVRAAWLAAGNRSAHDEAAVSRAVRSALGPGSGSAA